MDHPRSTLGTGEDNIGIPDDMRCKRSDGKQWRCTARSMPDKTVCEKHYFQAKKRATSSSSKASLKNGKKRPHDESDLYLNRKSDDFDIPLAKASDFSLPFPGKKKKVSRNRNFYFRETSPTRGISIHNTVNPNEDLLRDVQFEENWRPSKTPSFSTSEVYRTKPQGSFDTSAIMGYSDRDSDSTEDTGVQTCHQCRKTSRDKIIWCMKCDKRGYCGCCLSLWYSDIALEKIQEACPACRGTCNCRVCFSGDNVIKARIREIPVLERLQYLYCMFSSVLPVIKQIHQDQSFELELEKRIHGIEIDLVRTKLNADEQMCCNLCRIPIIDYHRHCSNCSYDLCLSCCQDIREASAAADVSGELGNNIEVRSQEKGTGTELARLRKLRLHMSDKFPKWKSSADGNIPCPPKEYGGCGFLSLNLSRIVKMNWVAKLVKNVEEMVRGCKVNEPSSDVTSEQNNPKLCQCAQREDSDDNFLYCPVSQDIKDGGIGDFRRHWVRGEPVIVRNIYDSSLITSWNPAVMRRMIHEIMDEKDKDENRIVKVVDCLSEVNIDLGEFIKGYSEGKAREDGQPQMLKLKNWPSPSASEEFLLHQRPEFISRLPFLEHIHSKWGLLNVAAKLPHYSLQNDVGPKIFISYGTCEELNIGDSVTNLHFKMHDMVYLMLHSNEMNKKDAERSRSEDIHESSKDSEVKVSPVRTDAREVEVTDNAEEKAVNHEQRGCNGEKSGRTNPGAYWDVFRKQDVQKLTEYIQEHGNEFAKPDGIRDDFATHPLYNEAIFLTKHHKRNLKEEFGVEPWSFEQHLGEAVFIPAGCPFQLRNLQSNVQLGLDFLSPESLGEAVRMAEEIRCLPNDHEAKLHIKEVGKMSLYAASSAIKEVQKLVLDPKLGRELGFDDPNLTATVSKNVDRMNKQRQITCA